MTYPTNSVWVAGVALIAVALPVAANEPAKPTKPSEPTIEVRLVDDSTVKLALLDERIEFITPHGRLTIPTVDIRRIDLGRRVPDEVAKQIEQAVADLGSNQFRKREEAMGVLLKHKDRSYAAVKLAAKSSDAEVVKRAEELIEKLQAQFPDSRLEMPDYDVIHTDLSKIAGRIATPIMRARSFTFGEVPLKLADAVAMSTSGFGDDKAVAGNGQPDPGSLTAYQQPQHINKTFTFRVTGGAAGSVWGTDIYTLDSTLAAAAVHAGVLRVGQTGDVRVTIMGPTVGFVGSTRNGVTTSNYANYPGAYRIVTRDNR